MDIIQRRARLDAADAIARSLGARPVHWVLDDGIEIGDNTDPENPDDDSNADMAFGVTTGHDDGLDEFCDAAGIPAAVERVREAKRARDARREAGR